MDTEDLLSFSYQVAKGMEFLASKNVSAHRTHVGARCPNIQTSAPMNEALTGLGFMPCLSVSVFTETSLPEISS